jgi:IS6 family transposase
VRQNRPALFRGRHFEDVIMMLCVRWYLRYSLSYRDLEEMMAEHFASAPSSRAPASESFLAGGQTYVRVAGNWRHLYRAVDSAGDTIDFMLSPKRDLSAAKLFLRLALSGTGGIRPRGDQCGWTPGVRVLSRS